MGQLEGKVALITGAAVGIGRAIAVACAREGAKVVVNYSKSRPEAETTAEMVRQAGGAPLVIRADVSQDRQVKTMVAETLDRFGRIDVLVNNAGVTAFVEFPDLDGLTDEVWDRLYDVNVKGVFFCCRAVAPAMRRQGQGCIVTIASVAGIGTQGSSIAYCASKAAVIHLSKCLAQVLAPEIRVNVIAPGFIGDTRWHAGRPNLEQVRQRSAQRTPLKRLGSAEEVAEAALFLASRADFLTGEVMVVDGGQLVA